MEKDDCVIAKKDDKEGEKIGDDVDDLIIINTDWTLEEAGTRIYGMCSVTVSPPCDHLSFKRGFPLHTPTHTRCGLFALILGLESIDRVWQTIPNARVVVTTKNKWLYSVLFDSPQVDKWETANKWPPSVMQLKNLLLRARDLAREYHGRIDVVGIDRDGDEQCEVDLLDYSKSGGVDLDKTVSGHSGDSLSCKQRLEKEMFNMRMRSVMVDELLSSGARGHCRGKKKVAKSKRDKKYSPSSSPSTKDTSTSFSSNGSTTTKTQSSSS